MPSSSSFLPAGLASLLLAAIAGLAPPALAAAFNPAPSAQLDYSVRARQSGIALSGRSKVLWQADSARYLTSAETSAMLVGKILEERSEGVLNAHGLQPQAYTEKRFRKEATTTSIDRKAGTVRFGETGQTQKLGAIEQDRASALWQLVGLLRAEKKSLKPGMSWRMTVAGQQDADPWIFTLQSKERLSTALGELDTVHLIRQPPAHVKERRVDIWLAPSQEWYPVRVRFEDSNGEYVEQFIEGIKRQ